MPFVPLGQRKPIPLVLDGDKEAIQARQRERDLAAINSHLGVAPGSSGYRFANHPQTFGHVRGPDVPFRNATAPWRPPEEDPQGPASALEREQAAYGGNWDAAHGMRKVRSTPALDSPSKAMEACHPLSMELRRWEQLAKRTTASEMNGQDLSPPPRRELPPPPKIGPNKQGLVLFPKYMLIHNCHLKMQDLQRFQREQAEEARRAEEEAEGQDVRGSPSAARAPEEAMYGSTRGPLHFEASWGAPKLKQQSLGGPHWAGSGMPAGRGQRTSNPFRMG